MNFNEWWQEDYEARQRRRNRVIWAQILGTVLIITVQVICNLTGVTPYPWAMVWVLLVVLWGLFCIFWMRRINHG